MLSQGENKIVQFEANNNTAILDILRKIARQMRASIPDITEKVNWEVAFFSCSEILVDSKEKKEKFLSSSLSLVKH